MQVERKLVSSTQKLYVKTHVTVIPMRAQGL